MRRCLSRVYFILILVLHWLWWRLQLLFQRSLSAMGNSLLLSYVKMPQYAENVIYFFSCFLWLPMLIYSINPIFIRSCWRGKCRRNECCWRKNEKNKWLSRFIFVHTYIFFSYSLNYFYSFWKRHGDRYTLLASLACEDESQHWKFEVKIE